MEQEIRTVCYDAELGIEVYRLQGVMQRFPNHFHEHYAIGYIESGKRKLICRNREYLMAAGDLLLLNPLDSHSCEQIDHQAMDYRCINIKPEIMKKTVKEITGKEDLPYFQETVIFHCEHIKLLREFHNAVMEEQTDFSKEESFLFLMEHLLEEYTKDLCQYPFINY